MTTGEVRRDPRSGRSARRGAWERAQTGHMETWVSFARDSKRSGERALIWRRMIDEVARGRPVEPGECILDVGCGLDTVLDHLPDVRGVTLDPLMPRLAGLGLSPRARHMAGVCEALPFADASFDRVFLANVLDHVRDPKACLAEVARVLRPGGQLVLSVDTYESTRYYGKRLHKWWARTRRARTKHPWVFSVGAIQRRLERTGFRPTPAGHIPGTKVRRSFFLTERVG